MYVRDDDRLAPLGSRAADAGADFDSRTRGLALERRKDEFAVFEQVEARPIQIRQRVINQRRAVGGVGDEVSFARDERAQLRREFNIKLRLRRRA